jgi:hypothetical protein
MDLPPNPTAAQLLALLRSDNIIKPYLQPWWHLSINDWTHYELREVRREAARNTSIKLLTVQVSNDMEEDTANKIASVISHFRNIDSFQLLRRTNADTEVPPAVVDKIISGMSQSDARLAFVCLCATGREQKPISDFLRAFPTISVLSFGYSDHQTCILSEEFEGSFVSALATIRQPSLKKLNLCCRGCNRGVGRILRSASSGVCPKLSTLEVDLDEDNDADLVLKDIGAACAPESSLKGLRLRWNGDGLLDLKPLFDGSSLPSLHDVCFKKCLFPEVSTLADSSILTAALDFSAYGCCFPDRVVTVLEKLPSLKMVCLLPEVTLSPSHNHAFQVFHCLGSNSEVESLAKFLPTRPTISDVFLGISGLAGNSSFNAIKMLFRRCTGSLNLSLFSLCSSREFVCQGLHACGRNPALKRVSLRFGRCGAMNRYYIRLLRILAQNKTLENFRLSLEGTMDLQQLSKSLTAILRQNGTLARLIFTDMSKEAAEAILMASFEGLRSNNALRALQFKMADGESLTLSESLLQPLLGALRECNHVFHELSGVSFPSDSATAAEIQGLMEQNRFGRRSALSTTMLPGLWARIYGNIASDGSARGVMCHFLRIHSSSDRFLGARGHSRYNLRPRLRRNNSAGNFRSSTWSRNNGGSNGGRTVKNRRGHRSGNGSALTHGSAAGRCRTRRGN